MSGPARIPDIPPIPPPVLPTSSPSTQPTRFEKLKTLVIQILLPFQDQKAKPDSQLTGRIQALQHTTQVVVEQLKNIKDNLRNSADKELYNFVESVVDPMIRDIARLEKTTGQQNDINDQMQTFERYAHWINRAKPLVQLFSTKITERKAIISAVVEQIVQNMNDQVSRDGQLIQDYAFHKLETLSLGDEKKAFIKIQLQNSLLGIIDRLGSIRGYPGESTLEQLSDWQMDAYRTREICRTAAFSIIDKVIQENSTKEAFAESRDEVEGQLGKHLQEIVELEELAPNLLRDIQDEKVNIKVVRERLNKLHDRTKKLEQELGLTPELVSRLQKVHRYLRASEDLLG